MQFNSMQLAKKQRNERPKHDDIVQQQSCCS